MATKRHVYEVYIRTTPARLWEAITKFEVVKRYYYGYGLRAKLRKGAPLEYVDPETGKVAIAGKILEVVPRKRLVHTFQFTHGRRREPPSRVTWEISKWQGVPLLRLVHDRLERSPQTYKSVQGGWGPILSGLKTLLETGKALWRG